MRVYVLGTGRCGEKTLASLCAFMTNYSLHEDKAGGSNRITIDKQLMWSIDSLDDGAMTVHLQGDREHTAAMYGRFGFDAETVTRWSPLLAGQLSQNPKESDPTACLEYVDAVNAKIQSALLSRTHQLTIRIATLDADFKALWDAIGAEGKLEGALDLLRIKRNLEDYLPLMSEDSEEDEVESAENPA